MCVTGEVIKEIMPDNFIETKNIILLIKKNKRILKEINATRYITAKFLNINKKEKMLKIF